MKATSVDLLETIPLIRHFALVDSSKDKCHTPWRILYDFEMIFVLDGELIVTEKDKGSYAIKKYDMHIMPPNVWHTRSVKENGYCKYYNVHFEFVVQNISLPVIDVKNVYVKPCLDGVKEVGVDQVLGQRVYCVPKNVVIPRKEHIIAPQEIIYCFEKMDEAFAKSNVFAEYCARGIFSYLLALILGGAQSNDLKCSIEWVIEKFKIDCTRATKKIDVEQFAERYGYSYVYFRNQFKRKTGVSPGTYAQNERLLLASRYLESEYYSITEIADMVGFENVFHFSSVFKKKFGKSPSSFLKDKNNNLQD